MSSVTVLDLMACASSQVSPTDDADVPRHVHRPICESELLCDERLALSSIVIPVPMPPTSWSLTKPHQLLGFETLRVLPLCLRPPVDGKRRLQAEDATTSDSSTDVADSPSSPRVPRRNREWLTWVNWDYAA